MVHKNGNFKINLEEDTQILYTNGRRRDSWNSFGIQQNSLVVAGDKDHGGWEYYNTFVRQSGSDRNLNKNGIPVINERYPVWTSGQAQGQ